MKLKRFLLITLFLCTFQMPAHSSVLERADSTSSTADFAADLFSFDPRLPPIKLEYVDFKINRDRTPSEWGKDIGQYNFKLFGCKRAEKKVILDQGRTMRRDMKFGNVFFEEMNEIFPVVVDKDSPYYPYSIGDKEPGYVITAEIKDLYINVCDHYDWRTRTYSQLRSGSAEIKVLWRVMLPYNRRLFWEDTIYGYATIEDPIRNGEVRLTEKAFADALARVVGMPGFMEVMRNAPNESELAKAKSDFDAMAMLHTRSRQKLMSSYRRKRMKFYNENKNEPIFAAPGALEKEFSDGRGLTSLEQGILERASEMMPGDYQNGIFGRLLTTNPLEEGFFGRLLSSSNLARFFEGFQIPVSALDNEIAAALLNGKLNGRYGFEVSQDGYITINNQKPFRYLSASRIYRIRSSVVAVTNGAEVGSGLVIAPALVLTNYSIAQEHTSLKVEFLDGRLLPAMVLRADKDYDVALLYIPPKGFDENNWPIPLRLDLPEINEKFYAIGTPMRGGFEGAMEPGKVAGYRYKDRGVEILTNTNVQSVTLGGILADETGNAVGLAHSGKSLIETRDGFIPVGDAFDILKIRIRDRDMDETPTQKALRLKNDRDDYIK